jgi:hypothetical protein
MKISSKTFRKDGFEGIWRSESMSLDLYEVDSKGEKWWLRSKQFTNSRVAESYFAEKVKSLPSEELKIYIDES